MYSLGENMFFRLLALSFLMITTLSASNLVDSAKKYSQAVKKYLESELGYKENRNRFVLREMYLSCRASNEDIARSITIMSAYDSQDLENRAKSLEYRVNKEWIQKNEAGILDKKEERTIELSTFLSAAKAYQRLLIEASFTPEFTQRTLAHQKFYQVVQLRLSKSNVEELIQELKEAGFCNDDLVIKRLQYWVEKESKGINNRSSS